MKKACRDEIIDYDLLGNPVRIQFTDRSCTEYVYAADGRRLKTTHTTAVPSSTHLTLGEMVLLSPIQILSVDSTEYLGNFLFDNGSFKEYHFDGGYLTPTGTPSTYRYYVKDHLGSNRILANNNGAVQQATHYYPYGGIHHFSTNQGTQKYKYNGKELDLMHGLNLYDYGARLYDPLIGHFTSIDPLCEKYYSVSPYAYCAGNPVNRVDVDGKSTWVINIGNGKYKVVGGNLNDKDKNIYVGTINENGAFIPQNSIGVTTSRTSFYYSDAKGGGRWRVGSVIDTKDKSGNNFLTMIISNNPPMFDDYIINARNNHPYDFKVTNGTGEKYGDEKFYRGMPIGVTGNGQIIFTSARDVGNIAAGYVAAANGMSWEASRIAFDTYQGGVEGISTRYAEYYGWKMGYNNTTNNQKADNLMSSFGSLLHTIRNYILNKIR